MIPRKMSTRWAKGANHFKGVGLGERRKGRKVQRAKGANYFCRCTDPAEGVGQRCQPPRAATKGLAHQRCQPLLVRVTKRRSSYGHPAWYARGAMEGLENDTSTHSGIVLRAFVVFWVVLLGGCDEDAPTGTYAAACDASATIEFLGHGATAVNRNFCEGYAVEAWEYDVNGDTLEMALKGRLGFDNPVLFQISCPEQLTAIDGTAVFTCGNCSGKDVWKKQ